MSFVTPWTGSLEEGVYEVEMPSNVLVGPDTYNFLQWDDGTTSPVKTINLTSDLLIQAIYELAIPPPPAKGILNIHTFLDDTEIVATLLIIETSESFTTPIMLEMPPGHYTLRAKHLTYEQDRIIEVIEGQTIRVDFIFQTTPIPSVALPIIMIGAGLTMNNPLIGIPILLTGAGLYYLQRRG